MPKTPRNALSETKGTVGTFWKVRVVSGVDDGIFLHAHQPNDFVALFEVWVARFEDFGETKATHDVAQRNGRQVGGAFAHPDSHGRIDGKEFYARESLTLLQLRHRRFVQFEVAGSAQPRRAFFQQ